VGFFISDIPFFCEILYLKDGVISGKPGGHVERNLRNDLRPET
jgi:hypothetical protein